MLGTLKPGDWLVLILCSLLIYALFVFFWSSSSADKVLIRSGGKIYAEAHISKNQTILVPGPLGNSLVVIQNQRARIARDPSPKQYCVKQGWLSSQGEIAICLPNQVSIELTGAKKSYDSLSY